MMLRSQVKKISSFLLDDELKQKHMSVAMYNAQARINAIVSGAQAYLDPFEMANENKIKNISKCKEHYRANSFYGVSHWLKRYSGYEGKICACIEHGVYFGSYVNPKEGLESGLPAVITFGQMRKRHLVKVSPLWIVPIGPYIQYAEPFYSAKDTEEIKARFGKTLLVFPQHSCLESNVGYDAKSFFSKIEAIRGRQSIDTVIVNIYYRDLNEKIKIFCKQHGYIISCAGHQTDPMFLSRLKSVIQLSDYTVSSTVGTHVGYCVSMNKPHAVLNSLNLATDGEDACSSPEKQHDFKILEEAFQEKADGITSKQIRLCNYYWGNDISLSRKEMHSMLTSCEARFKAMRG